jgi:hypothetical protein
MRFHSGTVTIPKPSQNHPKTVPTIPSPVYRRPAMCGIRNQADGDRQMPTLELSRETENAIKAGRFADLLNRNLCKKKYARIQQKMLSEATESVLHYYHEGPSGDPEQDTETLNLVFAEYARWWFAAKHEYNARVQIIRNSDDVIRGLIPSDTNLSGQYGGARSEVDYVLELKR